MNTPVPHRRNLFLVIFGLLLAGGDRTVRAHDVPDRFFDRSVQVTIYPDRIHLDYHLSLTQFTLAEELLHLVGPGGLSGSEPSERLAKYADEMAPLLARGLLVRVDEIELPARPVAVSHRMEDHPRFSFAMEVSLVGDAAMLRRLSLEDTNFFLERGGIRIAIAARAPSKLVESTVPAELDGVETRSAWQLSPEQQDAMRRADAVWQVLPQQVTGLEDTVHDGRPLPSGPGESSTGSGYDDSPPRRYRWGRDLVALLDRQSSGLAVILMGLAFFFGAVHALTPGHGKTMVAAYLVGERGTLRHAVSLSLTTSLTHTGSVLAVAAILAMISRDLDRKLHYGFCLASGLLVAVLGAGLLLARLRGWLLKAGARYRQDCLRSDSHSNIRSGDPAPALSGNWTWFGLVTLGVSGGIVPCWDAVTLLLMAMAQGQLSRGVYLLLSFSAGLASVLVLVGVLAVKLRGYLSSRIGSGPVVQALPVVSAAVILVIGLYLCVLTVQAPGGLMTFRTSQMTKP